MLGGVRRWWRRMTARPEPPTPEHVPGRAHLVLEDGTIVEAELDDAGRARLEYLARRAAPPPPPEG